MHILDLYFVKVPRERVLRRIIFTCVHCPSFRQMAMKTIFGSLLFLLVKIYLLQWLKICVRWLEWQESEVIIVCEPLVLHPCFENDVPEKVIQERSGHRSIDALRVNKKTSDKNH